jgi:hypothetical protein
MEEFHGRGSIMFVWKRLRLAGPTILLVLLAFVCSVSAGKIRKATVYSTFISSVPTPETYAFFRTPEAPWSYTGGVVLRGRAEFYYETGANSTRIPIQQLKLQSSNDGIVTISRNGKSFRLDTFPKLPCNLGKFIERGAIVAYTELDGVTEAMAERMSAAGLVDSSLGVAGLNHRIAREFFNTPFERLFERADNVLVADLDEDLARQTINNLNARIGSDPNQFFRRGSYVHADFQVVYKVYLIDASNEVDIEGVPLRYELEYNRGGLPHVIGIQAFAQNWPDDAKLTKALDPSTAFSQYDIVWTFQTAAIFRELHQSNGSAFSKFVADACS